jgi:hypothetical protein
MQNQSCSPRPSENHEISRRVVRYGAACNPLKAAATVLTGILIIASSSFAAKPESGPEAATDVVFPAGMACPAFDVHIVTETRGLVKVFGGGDIQSTGYERGWVTNLSSGKQVELMVNGRVRIDFPPTAVQGVLTITGPQIIVFFPGDAGPGDRSQYRLYYFKGKATAIVDANFAYLDFAFSGTSIELCSELE